MWPAYIKAHESVFDPSPDGPLKDTSITLLEPGEGQDEVTRIVDEACAAILGAYEAGLGNVIG